MEYKVIKNRSQYNEYCNILDNLLDQGEEELDKIELLTLLIENWDRQNSKVNDYKNPVDLIKALMKEKNLKSKDLAQILDLSEGTISKILNFHKGLSKETIRKLSNHFKMAQEAFNRPYELMKGKRKRRKVWTREGISPKIA